MSSKKLAAEFMAMADGNSGGSVMNTPVVNIPAKASSVVQTSTPASSTHPRSKMRKWFGYVAMGIFVVALIMVVTILVRRKSSNDEPTSLRNADEEDYAHMIRKSQALLQGETTSKHPSAQTVARPSDVKLSAAPTAQKPPRTSNVKDPKFTDMASLVALQKAQAAAPTSVPTVQVSEGRAPIPSVQRFVPKAHAAAKM